MSRNQLFLFLSFLSVMVPEPIQASYIEYVAIANTSTSSPRFNNEIGLLYSAQTLAAASAFVLETFNQKEGEGKGYHRGTLIVESFSADRTAPCCPVVVASSVNYTNTIRLDSDYIQSYRHKDVKAEFTGTMYHESTRVWQWTGNGLAPIGLITGIADYVRLKAGYPAKDWVKRGSGSSWYEGYAVTAYFLEYCSGPRPGFVSDLNGLYEGFLRRQLLRAAAGEECSESLGCLQGSLRYCTGAISR